MADAAVDFLLENLDRVVRRSELLNEAEKKQVRSLTEYLCVFRSFLRSTIKTRRQDESLWEVIRQIRDIVYEAEDHVDAFVSHTALTHDFICSQPLTLDQISNRVQAFARRVEDVYGTVRDIIANQGTKDDKSDHHHQPPKIRHEDVVGFDDKADQIIGYLLENKDELDVISIIGMRGLGKTTLARKIFCDERIQRGFDTHRIWIDASQELTKKEVYVAILRELNIITKDMYQKTHEELAQIVKAHLGKGKFLIVMDDVMWTAEDWNEIQSAAFPESNGACKVLVTSCNDDVGHHARAHLSLDFLTPEESWSLLQLEVFGPKLQCPPELQVLEKLIADLCKRLPLAIVVVGGILTKKLSKSDNMSVKMVAWTKVLNSISKMDEDPQERLKSIIVWSYNKLPYHLRACFLYLGMFPYHFEIPVWKLIRMWIAEGFIQQRSDDISLEVTAENYLDELINWNLVKVVKRRLDGRVKTCRIDHMLHDFCKKEAASECEKFLQEIKSSPEGFEAQICRRICIHSKVLKFVSSKVSGPCIRSFTCFAKRDLSLSAENSTSAIPDAFKLLRILDIMPIKFTEIPRGMYQLLHLRYIALSFNANILPQDFAKLWNIQTLIVDTTSPTLQINADIWELSQLRHLKTNVSTSLSKAGKNSKEGENLQTLGTISPQSCTKDVFDRARYLKKLGIHGKLSLLFKGNTTSLFDNLGRLDSLEKLKLLNDDHLHRGLKTLPPSNRFPPNLKSLTLSYTFLEWEHMSTLALLERLEVLKLKNHAIMGKSWESTAEGFRSLLVLHIDNTDLIEWKASKLHFPKLRCLYLHNCKDLKGIPISLADVPDFQLLDLYNSKHAVGSAQKIREAKNQQVKNDEFKLSIFPLVE